LAGKTQMTAEHIRSTADLAVAVARYLQANGLAPEVCGEVFGMGVESWRRAGVSWRPSPVRTDGDTCVSQCLALIAENGAAVTSSGEAKAISDEFLAATHIIFATGDQLLGTMAELWQLLGERQQNGQDLPREFCLVTGPSRTADLGLPAKLGAHGPARVHVIYIGESAA